jgi:cytochrome b561
VNTKNGAPLRYNTLSIGLHWLSALLVIAAIVLIEMKGWFPKSSPLRDGVKLWHFQIGATVLLVTLLRLFCMLTSSRPAPVAPKGSLAQRLGASAHGLLYLLLLLLPLSGVMILVAAGKPVSLLSFDLPVWSEESRDTAKSIKKLHELFGNAMIALILVHAAAAVWHQFVRKDGLMQRMLPRRRE